MSFPVKMLVALMALVITGEASAAKPTRRIHPGRSHAVVKASRSEWNDLTTQGARILAVLPAGRLVVSVPDGVMIAGAEAIGSETKFSGAMDEGAGYYVVAFHNDVTDAAIDGVAGQAQWNRIAHADLLRNQLLIQATPEVAAKAAEWDEVARVFPATAELVNGIPTAGCPGAVTEYGAIAEYVATIGPGWGNGNEPVTLTYSFGRISERVHAPTARSTFQRALAEWSRHAAIDFREITDQGARRNLNFMFGSGSHGDPYAFDGRGRVLAHTFFPNPPNPEPLAGDVHFDDDETWTGTSPDLFAVALHEIGHALGLGHSDRPSAVMYPYYRAFDQLQADDVAALRRLYLAPLQESARLRIQAEGPASVTASSVQLSGSVTGGSSPVRVSWASSSGRGYANGEGSWTIPALPLVVGPNEITLTATDGSGATATLPLLVVRQEPAAPVAIQITRSVLEGNEAWIEGTASHPEGLREVQWTLGAGAGRASGTATWSVRVALAEGSNEITIRATAENGATGTASVRLVYAPVRNDVTPPVLVVTSPGLSLSSTSRALIRITGTAQDPSRIAQVTVTTGGATVTATGTESWAAEVPLLTGTNTLVIRARDFANNTASRTIQITRR